MSHGDRMKWSHRKIEKHISDREVNDAFKPQVIIPLKSLKNRQKKE